MAKANNTCNRTHSRESNSTFNNRGRTSNWLLYCLFTLYVCVFIPFFFFSLSLSCRYIVSFFLLLFVGTRVLPLSLSNVLLINVLYLFETASVKCFLLILCQVYRPDLCSEEAVQEMEQRVIRAGKKVAEGRFEPSPSLSVCTTCPFADICDARVAWSLTWKGYIRRICANIMALESWESQLRENDANPQPPLVP